MSLVFVALAYADHPGGATRAAPLSPLASALFWAGLAALAVLVVFGVITILTRRPAGEDREQNDHDET